MGNDDVSIVRARKQEIVRKIPEGTNWVDFMKLIVQSYFDALLRYVLSVALCGAAVLKVMDQKTLVKRR